MSDVALTQHLQKLNMSANVYETNAKVVELSNIAASTQLDVNNFNASSVAASKMSDVGEKEFYIRVRRW